MMMSSQARYRKLLYNGELSERIMRTALARSPDSDSDRGLRRGRTRRGKSKAMQADAARTTQYRLHDSIRDRHRKQDQMQTFGIHCSPRVVSDVNPFHIATQTWPDVTRHKGGAA